MSSKIKRYPRTRSAKTFCEEKFACHGESIEAVYFCDQCATAQCPSCEHQIHQQQRLVSHDRKQIEQPPASQLCAASCTSKNLVDVKCTDCDKNFCLPCFDRTHSFGPRRLHKKVQIKGNLSGAVYEKNDFETEDLVAIKPLSPTGEENDNLVYFSAPQMQLSGLNLNESEKHSFESTSSTSEIFQSLELMDNLDMQSKETRQKGHKEVFSHSTKRLPSAMVSPTTKQEVEVGYTTTSLNVNDEDISIKAIDSFLLADQRESLKVANSQEFASQLRCDQNAAVKVLSIFGNTGDGKSHTLNHTFFGGVEVFKTSPEPDSCTMGVWTAFDPDHNVILLDSEGLLGVSPNQNQRTRLLLKVMAISDIVVYRTRAERLHEDLFRFLGDASKAFMQHFNVELKSASKRLKIKFDKIGPSVIIFHETLHTSILKKNVEATIRERFHELGLGVEAFSSLDYVGTRTERSPTDFSSLLATVKAKLANNDVRCPRKPDVVFKALQVLNEKFTGEIESCLPETFPDQYFTCPLKCLSCGERCKETVNHTDDEVTHQAAKARCIYQHQYDNRVFLCKSCLDHRAEAMVVVPKTSASAETSWLGLAKYAWSGYVLECPACGVIYRSRQFWYGNEEPDKSVVKTEIRHVWPGGNTVLQGTHNAARRMFDGISYVSGTIASISAKPSKAVSAWLTDRIAPPYWVPNAQITACYSCEAKLDAWNPIHHCRACGKGFCDDCTQNKKPVPERGWGMESVRVCDNCFSEEKALTDSTGSEGDGKQLMPRMVGEAIGSSVGSVATLFNYPLDLLRDSARPAYWQPDSELTACSRCEQPFGPKVPIHHCRCCGQGVCGACSPTRRPVPSRGWDYDVRVCAQCDRKSGQL